MDAKADGPVPFWQGCTLHQIIKKRVMIMKRILAMTLSAILALGVLAGCGGGNAPEQPADTAQPENTAQSEDTAQDGQDAGTGLGTLASFTAGTLDGGTFTQDDIMAKDVTVINFWALSCGPCIVEMPDLAEFAGALPDNVQLVTVCLDGNGNEDTAREVLEKAGFDGVTLISGSGDLLDLSRSLMYTPTTVFVDGEGVVADAVIGGQEDLSGTFLAAVNAVLEGSGKAEISLEK